MKKAFTLVELLAVIVILAIILIIAVPQIMNTIENSRLKALESSGMMIASTLETKYSAAKVLDKAVSTAGACTDLDETLDMSQYSLCTYNITNEEMSVYLVGSDTGKFKGYSVTATKNTANAVVGNNGPQSIITINFDADGGVIPESNDNYWMVTNNGTKSTKQVVIGSTYDNMPIPTKTDYTFIGWYTAITNGTLIVNSTIVTSNNEQSQTIYAHWINSYYTFDYTGMEQNFTVPINGTYKLEVWGGQGGNSLQNGASVATGGYGGYSVGLISLTQNMTLYINVAGKGADGVLNTDTAGGYNGGGSGKWDHSDDESTGGGGGATHISTSSGVLSSLSSLVDKIIIVAGGGGGGAWTYFGGSAGGMTGSKGVKDNNTDISGYYSTPGTQTAGYLFGQGGTGSSHIGTPGGGGGGGYYGGSGGIITSYDAIPGAGGSGYIGNSDLTNKMMYCYNCTESSDVSTKTISTTCTSATAIADCAKSGNGYAKITFISAN